MDSSSAISSTVSLTDNAPMLCSRFSILVVPGMGTTSFPWWRTQANASCEVVHPFFVASSLILSYMILLCSRFSGCNLGNCTAVTGCTAWALLMVDADASDNPTYLILPSSTSFFSSPIYY
ncbi:hypothetical protein Hanom_Chr14g01280301 [Helianthus anomalus]